MNAISRFAFLVLNQSVLKAAKDKLKEKEEAKERTGQMECKVILFIPSTAFVCNFDPVMLLFFLISLGCKDLSFIAMQKHLVFGKLRDNDGLIVNCLHGEST